MTHNKHIKPIKSETIFALVFNSKLVNTLRYPTTINKNKIIYLKKCKNCKQ